jgi:hypothetical protein
LVAIVAVLCGSGCHDPNQGQSSANEVPIADGDIILLRRGNEVAAVILRNERVVPEKMDFTWYYRSDGRGTFAPGDPAVSTGTVSNAGIISFRTFSAEWSTAGTGMGWVYFSTGPTEFKTADYLMCVTTQTNLATMDATDKKWEYRGRPGINMKALIDSQIKK